MPCLLSCLERSAGCPPTLTPPNPFPLGRTLLEAKMWHPLDGCVSLLHELVEADQEGLFLLLLPTCLRGVLGREQEAWMGGPN